MASRSAHWFAFLLSVSRHAWSNEISSDPKGPLSPVLLRRFDRHDVVANNKGKVTVMGKFPLNCSSIPGNDTGLLCQTATLPDQIYSSPGTQTALRSSNRNSEMCRITLARWRFVWKPSCLRPTAYSLNVGSGAAGLGIKKSSW